MTLRLLALAAAFLGSAGAIAQDVPVDKSKLSYAVGYDMGQAMVERKIEVDPGALQRGIQDGMAHRPPSIPEQQLQQILQNMQQHLLASAKADFDKASSDNMASSQSFLARNRAKPGVRILPSGVQYRIIEEGTGPAPRPDGQVRILYRAAISTGQEFASSYNNASPQPTTVVIGESPLAGIKQVLPMMRQGSHWEIALPPDQAYGSGPGSPIGPNQAVMFDIKIVEVLK